MHHAFCYPFSEPLSVRVPYVISEIALGFRPMRNGKIFKRIISSYWMRSSVIWRILQIEVCVMRLIDMGFFVFFFSFNMF